MIRRPPDIRDTETPFPYTTLSRSPRPEAKVENTPGAVANTTRGERVEKAHGGSLRERQRVEPRQVGEYARITFGGQLGRIHLLLALDRRAKAGEGVHAPNRIASAASPGPKAIAMPSPLAPRARTSVV